MPLSIQRSSQAQYDQNDIWLNIAIDNIRAADRVIGRINDAIFMLAAHPEAGRSRDDLQVGLRYFPAGSYLIFYTTEPNILGIRRVLHGARNIDAEFFEQ